MKRFVVVGLGNFGATIAEQLYKHGHEVVALDVNEAAVDRIAPFVSHAVVGDGREIDILRRAGAEEADVGIVSTGDDITACVLATLALLDIGVKKVCAKVISVNHARVMERLGAAETVFPELDSARNLATRLSDDMVINYVSVGGGVSLQEIMVPDEWIGRTIRDLDLRRRFGITIVGLHDAGTDKILVPPDPDLLLKKNDTLLIAGDDLRLHDVSRSERR